MGALTSKPYAFSARPWELADAFAVDHFDTLHSPLRLSLRGTELLRILPDLRYSSLNEWISDRSRFSYDAVACNRSGCFSFFFRGLTVLRPVSKAYLSGFFFPRFFCFSMIDFSFFGFEQTAFKSRELSRAGLLLGDSRSDVPYMQASATHYFLAQPPAPSSVVTVGLSLRYTHPVLLAYLKRLKKTGCLLVDLGDGADSLDYALGSSLRNFFTFFRFKMRPSLLVAGGLFVTSLRLYHFFPQLFNNNGVLVLPESPASGFFSDLGVKFASAGFRQNSRFTFSFSSHVSSLPDFLVPSSHPYETKFVSQSAFSSNRVCTEPSLPATSFFYDFFSNFADEVVTSGQIQQVVCPVTAIINSPRAQHYSNVYSTYNYFDHFAGYATLRNSTNILLNLRRNEDYRHTHFCSF